LAKFDRLDVMGFLCLVALSGLVGRKIPVLGRGFENLRNRFGEA